MVLRVTEPEEPHRHVLFVRALLYTHRNFTSPVRLLHKLIMRFHVSPDTSRTTMGAVELAHWVELYRRPVQRSVCEVLRRWLQECPKDFTAEMLAEVEEFCERDVFAEGHGAIALRLLARVKELQGVDDASNNGGDAGPPSQVSLARRSNRKFTLGLTSSGLDLSAIIDYPVEEIAQQWTSIQASDAYGVTPFELLVSARNKKSEDHLRPHVLQSIERFRKLNNWVASTILTTAAEQQRVQVVEKFIDLCEAFMALNNYNGVAAVYAGLTASSVHRLTETFDKISEASRGKLADFEKLMRRDENYRVLRRNIREATGPCIPYLGIFIHDLVVCSEVNPTFKEDNPELINFDKCTLLLNAMWEVLKHQQRLYAIRPNNTLLIKIAQLESVSDNTLYDLSLKIQPRAENKQRSNNNIVNKEAKSPITKSNSSDLASSPKASGPRD